jgi:16S rRNA (guanine966-N2)-methyltransferase
MRILSGIYRGQKVLFPERDVLRPTQEKVRAAIFNILQNDIENCRFLDLCCGTGSMGIEALSRGAKYVHLVDIQTDTVTENVNRLKPTPTPESVHITTSSATRFLSTLQPNSYDVIFCDPPWKEVDLYAEALTLIAKTKALSPKGILFIEHHRDYDPAPYPSGKNKNRVYAAETDSLLHEKKMTVSPKKKSHKRRLTNREMDEAVEMVRSGFGERPHRGNKTNGTHQREDSILTFDDTDGQWSPSAKQLPKKSFKEANPLPTKRQAYAELQAAYPEGFPLAVSNVYHYSDTHLTRMEYPHA